MTYWIGIQGQITMIFGRNWYIYHREPQRVSHHIYIYVNW